MISRSLIFIAGATLATSAFAQQGQQRPIAYPSQGQSEAQQVRDQDECYSWAQNNTGINLAEIDPEQESGRAERARGAATGAVAGGAIGGITGGRGSVGTGAGVGAVLGLVQGRQQAQQNRSSQEQARVDTFNRAWATCMEGRGYSVR